MELPVEIMEGLQKKFLISTQKIIAQMQEAEKEKDYESLYALAHKLKGASSSLCLDKITDVALMLENAIKKGDQRNCEYLVSKILDLYEDIKQYEGGDTYGTQY